MEELAPVPPPGVALVEVLDKKLLVQLRDNRKFIGILRSFDQFANLVLEGAYERKIVRNMYNDSKIGLLSVRGENVVLLGEIDEEREIPPNMVWVSAEDIDRAEKAEAQMQGLQKTMRARMDFLDEL